MVDASGVANAAGLEVKCGADGEYTCSGAKIQSCPSGTGGDVALAAATRVDGATCEASAIAHATRCASASAWSVHRARKRIVCAGGEACAHHCAGNSCQDNTVVCAPGYSCDVTCDTGAFDWPHPLRR